MSSQTIYFTNPNTITQLQSKAGINNVCNPSVQIPNFQTLVNSQLACSSAPSLTTLTGDRYGTGCKQGFYVFGNVSSGEEYFVSSGQTSSANSTAPTIDNYHQPASCTKILFGLALSKLFEEGYCKPNDTVATYLPQFSGNGYYYVANSCTGTFGTLTGTNAFLSTYTGTKSTFDLSTITINQILGLQFASPYPLACMGINVQNWATAPTIPVGADPTIYSDWQFNVACKDVYTALWNGVNLGATGSLTGAGLGTAIREYQFDKAYSDNFSYNGWETDYLNTTIGAIKSGVCPLVSRPGETMLTEWNIRGTRAYYAKINWCILSAVASNAIRKRQGGSSISNNFLTGGTAPYYNFYDYFRAKVLTPMGITNDAWNGSNKVMWYAGYEAPPTNAVSNSIESSFRRNIVVQNPDNWSATGVSSAYTGAYTNSLVWATQFPDDIFGKLNNTTEYPTIQDIYGPSWEGRCVISCRTYTNFLRLIYNKGVHIPLGSTNGTRIIGTMALNYMMNTCIGVESAFFSYGGIPRQSGNYRFMMLGCAQMDDSFAVSRELQANGYNSVNPASMYDLRFPMSRSMLWWGGSFGTTFVLDLDTGFYTYGGTQLNVTMNYPILNTVVTNNPGSIEIPTKCLAFSSIQPTLA